MKNISYSIGYQAKTIQEFRELMEEFGDKATPAISKPADERGPNEAEFIKISGKSRLRLTLEEQGRVDRGEATRESIAAERLESLQNPPSSDSVMDGPPLVTVSEAPADVF